MSKPAGQFKLHIEQVDGFELRVAFDKAHYEQLLLDEPAPLGQDAHPNPARILAAAIGSCLSASLIFCLGKAKIPVETLSAEVGVELVRNDRNRLRIGAIDVTLEPRLAKASTADACVSVFEDFCVVTQSVREGIDVRVRVNPTESD